MPKRLAVEKRREAKRLYWSGMSQAQVAVIVSCARTMVSKLKQVSPWPPRERWPRCSRSYRAGRFQRSIYYQGTPAAPATRKN